MSGTFCAVDESEIVEGKTKVVRVGEAEICLLKLGARYFAFSNVCPHIGGRLSEGTIISGGRIACPMHKAVFRLEDGSSLSFPRRGLKIYRVQVERGKVLIGDPMPLKWREQLPCLGENWWTQ